MEKVFAECGRCGKEIGYKEAFVSIIRNIEQAEYVIARGRDEIGVIDSKELITLCGKCGNAFNADTISKIIKAIPLDERSSNSNS